MIVAFNYSVKCKFVGSLTIFPRFLMKIIEIASPLIRGDPLSAESDRIAQISVVSYEHQLGIPARFCAGLLPAIELYRKFELHAIKSVIRLVDPTPIVDYCNGWVISNSIFRDVISQFLQNNEIRFFFDQAEPVGDDALSILQELGSRLENPEDTVVRDIVQRIRESGRKHGGDMGAKNSIVYMVAHPFSWLNMHHPSLWKKPCPQDCQLFNLMSRSEERYSLVRKFLQTVRPDLAVGTQPFDIYMNVCDTPCYMPLEGEPRYVDLLEHGYEWCHGRYTEIKKRNSNYERICRDFRLLRDFVGSSGS